MQSYRDFRPTNYDTPGLSLPERQNWLVVPVGHSRDSDTLAESNFKTAEQLLGELDPEGDDHEIHRFNHWACGWFEIIIVKPDSTCATKAVMIENSLNDYPVLNESDYSEREAEADCS